MTPPLVARLRGSSIVRTLTLVIWLTAAATVALACIAFVAFDAVAARRDMQQDINALGNVVGSNCAAAILFNDRQWASDVLSGLASDPHMLEAAVFAREGTPLATWARKPNAASPVIRNDGTLIDGRGLTMFRPILLDGERVGTVYLASSVTQLYQRMGNFLFAALLVLSGATVAAFAVSTRVQRRVSRPILELAAAAHHVSSERDYSTRVPVRAGDEIGLLTQSFNDMLAQIQAQNEALRASEAQLRQSQKLEAIGRLAGGVAHDFNNLLTAIRGYSELTLDDPGLQPEMRENIGEVMHAADRAAALTRQLLAFSRKQMLTPCVLDVGDVVGGMQKMLRRLISEDIELVYAVAGGLDHVRADRGQLEQVILNLAVNARDAMADGGVLRIEASNVCLDADYAIRHAEASAGSYVMIAVTDSGCGMDEQTKARIFEPFFTTKEQGQGTGLGLAMVYGIVKQSGGFVWVYSEPGQGTTFKVYLPRVASPEGAVDTPIESEAPPRGSETILLVEDEEQVRRFTTTLLRRQGYQVLEADGGAAAQDIARTWPGGIDLMLTDVIMPQMNGRQVFERVHALRPGIKVVFMSGYTETGIVQKGVIEEGIAFVQKPFSHLEVARTIRSVLDNALTAPRLG